MTHVVSIRNLTVRYGQTIGLRDVSFDLPTGKLIGVLGPNGSGKSSLIKALVGAVKHSGSVDFSRPIGAASVAYVPQQSAIDLDFPVTVQDVVEQGRFVHLGLFGRFRQEDRDAVNSAMLRVGIADLSDRPIGQLSGGQRQRAFLARALAQNAQTLLFDEPFAGVDATTESAIIQVLRELRDRGNTIVVVHHDLNTAQSYFDHLVLLRTDLIAEGRTDQVFTPGLLRATYGGQVAIFEGTT
jgi:manganese/zinc/iron transport system ATP- binding protein